MGFFENLFNPATTFTPTANLNVKGTLTGVDLSKKSSTYAPRYQNTYTYSPQTNRQTSVNTTNTTTTTYAPVNAPQYSYAPQIAYYSPNTTQTSKKELIGPTSSPTVTPDVYAALTPSLTPTLAPTITPSQSGGIGGGLGESLDLTTILLIAGVGLFALYLVKK